MGCASEDRLLGGVLGVDLGGLDNLKALDALCVEGEEGAAAGFALVFDHSAYAHGAVEEVVKQFCPLALVGLAVVFIEFDEELLSSIVDGVLLDAKQIRRYPTSYTEDQILRDMESGMGIFRSVALSRYNMIGIENETYHTEGEVARHFISAGKEWSGWNPLAVSV